VRFSKSKFSIDNADLNFMVAAEQIFNDYLDVLKLIILPKIDGKHDLKFRELRVVITLGSSNGPISATDLSLQLRQDPSTITRSIIALVRDGYVVTEESPLMPAEK